LDDLPM